MHPSLADVLAEYAGLNALAANTFRLHRIGVTAFGQTLGWPATAADFSDAALGRHITRRLAEGCSRATVAGETAKLLALWRYACRQRYVKKWPTIRPPRIPDRVPLAWTREEVARLFDVVQLAKQVGDVPGRLWWEALLSCLYDSAERIGAMLALEWSGVDLAGRTIIIPAECRKGQTADRLYRIAPDTAARLDRLPRDRRPFHWPYNPATLWNRYRRLLTLAGLPSDRRSQFHRIRRTTASHYEAAGGDATELLGHTSRKVTRCYLDPRICGAASPVDLLFRPGE